MTPYRSTIIMLVAPLFCTKATAAVPDKFVSSRLKFACFVESFPRNMIGNHRRPDYCSKPITSGVRSTAPFRASMCTSSKGNDKGNSTDIFSSVGAAGNLRFKKSGTNPVDQKREEPNFKVKQVTEEAKSAQDQLKQQGRFQDKSVTCHDEQGEFVQDILDSIANVVNSSSSSLKHSYRDNGKWRSITVLVPVQSAEQLYEVYAAVGRDPRVKFKF